MTLTAGSGYTPSRTVRTRPDCEPGLDHHEVNPCHWLLLNMFRIPYWPACLRVSESNFDFGRFIEEVTYLIHFKVTGGSFILTPSAISVNTNITDPNFETVQDRTCRFTFN